MFGATALVIQTLVNNGDLNMDHITICDRVHEQIMKDDCDVDREFNNIALSG